MKRIVVAVVSAGLLLAGCTGGGGGTKGGDAGFVQGSGITVVPSEQRKEPVSLSGTTLDGKSLDLAAYRGNPVVINVWGSWCSPCREEAPALQAASVELATKDVKMVGINTADHDPAKAIAFEKNFGVTYPSLVDKGDLLLRLKGAVPPNAIPTTLVLDAQGRIAARVSGAITKTTLVDLVEDASAQ
ncbi:TlpA family protein disulfide reductase [Spongisporangium articulatum]|uniref:TlpA family protein disulfide reductase n=1 Tax=Spongisporangium articulatum TaxID=3362603 RepID=A0ABW8ANM8_9ACTN